MALRVTGSVLVCVAVFATVFVWPSVDAASWSVEVADSVRKVGTTNTGIALDSTNRPYICYSDETNDDLRFAWKPSATWQYYAPATSGRVGGDCSIAVDSLGGVHISYQEGDEWSLEYVYRSPAGAWVPPFRIDDGGPFRTGFGPDIAVDALNRPHISYVSEAPDHLRYAIKISGAWTTEDVPVSGVVSGSTSIAVDSQKLPHILFADYTNFPPWSLKYIKKVSSASWGVPETIETAGNLAAGLGLALDGSDKPHAVYQGTGSVLRYAEKPTTPPPSWTFVTLDPGESIYMAIDIGGSGQVHVSYFSVPSIDLRYVTQIGGIWGSPETVDSAGAVGFNTDIAVDSCNQPHISYVLGSPEYDLKYARGFCSITVSGYKVEDLDGDGVWDTTPPPGEQGLVGWTIKLYRNGDPIPYLQTTTDSTGFYSFGIAEWGTYEVREAVQSGWTPTNPTSGSHFFTAQSGQNLVFNFLNFQHLTVSGKKYNDLNGNGVVDGFDYGLPSWDIQLSRNGGPPTTIQTDAATGAYSFTVTQSGTYVVSEILQAGWTQTAPTPIPPGSYTFTAQSGQNQPNKDFLNFQNVFVSGRKIDDSNGNGVLDLGELGVSGWLIELRRNGLFDQSTTAGSGGFYSFTVTRGGFYEIREGFVPGWTQTAPTPIPPGSFTFVAQSGQIQLNKNFLNFRLGSICGFKFYDYDHDSFWDVGSSEEVGIRDWQIELWKGGILLDTEFTNAAGAYCFSNVGPGEHEVREIMPYLAHPQCWAQTYPGGDGIWRITLTSGIGHVDANFGNVCEYKEGLTWGYWKTHTGFDGPDYDPTYALLPDSPLQIDVVTPDGDYLVETAFEADWVFEGAGGPPPDCSGSCRSLFRAQLLALHMNLLKYGGLYNTDPYAMWSQIYQFLPADPFFSGWSVGAIHKWMKDLLVAASPFYDFAADQTTIDRINNNSHQAQGSHVLVCPVRPPVVY